MNARYRPRRGVPRSSQSADASPARVATLAIESIAAGGNGVGRVDGIACFVPRAAPGDTVQATLRMRRRFAIGTLLQVLDPSPQRVEPRCRHYISDKCGGCQLQHLEPQAQRTARTTIVRDAMQRLARRDAAMPSVEAGPSDWEYRRRLTLTLQRRGSRFVGGLHPYDDPSRVFDLTECPITQPLLVNAWTAVRTHTDLLPDAPSLRLALRLLDDGTVAIVVSGGHTWKAADVFVSRVAARASFVREVWWEPEQGALQPVARRDRSDTDIDAFTDDALSFVQINAPVAELLRDFVADRIVAYAPQQVVDVYAGSGLLTERLARAGVTVTSIELDVNATRRAAHRVRDLAGVRVLTGAAEQLLPAALSDTSDVVVVNPPRRGLAPGMAHLLDNSRTVRHIVYISCDPATLARDLSAMSHWRIAEMRCFDMFPQTAHIETVCLLEQEKE